jgi:hypothetical protein
MLKNFYLWSDLERTFLLPLVRVNILTVDKLLTSSQLQKKGTLNREQGTDKKHSFAPV